MFTSHQSSRRALASILGIVLLLVACGSDGTTQSETTQSDSTVATSEPVVAEDAATAAPVEEASGSDATETASDDAGAAETEATDAESSVATTLEPPTETFDTTAGWQAAQWSDNVTVTAATDTFQYQSDGIPSHELPDQFLVPQEGAFTPPVTEDEVSPVDTSIAVVASPIDQTIPANPVYTSEPTDTGLGIIGVAISGAQLFNDYEDLNREFVAVDDAFAVGGIGFVDSCNGHPLALAADGSGQGDYHYHGVPYCITDAIDSAGEHSTILGFLRDGFPFYGPQDLDGAIVTSDDLDECSGHFGPTPEFPDGIYHYHLTEDRSPYTIDCYHGEIEAGTGPPPRG